MDIVWDYKHPDKQLVRSLADALDASETFASLLVNRGIKTAEEAVSFITPPVRKPERSLFAERYGKRGGPDMCRHRER